MQFDLNHPNIAHKIVVVDIAPKFYPVHHSLILEGLNSLDVAHLENRQVANEHMKRFEENEGVRQFLLKNLHRTGENGFEWKINLKVITKNIDVVGLELWVNQPSETIAIFIKGAESHYIQPEDQRLISEKFPNFELFEIPHASHWVQADQPVAFLEVINSIL
jgi:pimeloyl-ACP methyl ester carboxylesterase